MKKKLNVDDKKYAQTLMKHLFLFSVRNTINKQQQIYGRTLNFQSKLFFVLKNKTFVKQLIDNKTFKMNFVKYRL